MEIRKNMYVRFKDKRENHYIRKIVEIPDDKRYASIYIDKEANNSKGLSPKNIIATSYDILDLLKPLDLMYIDIDPYDGLGGIVVPRIAETMAELNKYKALIKMGEYKLISITTREKINNSSYMVDEQRKKYV